MRIDRKLFEEALQITKKGISKKADDIKSKTLVEMKNSGVSLVAMSDGITVITNMPPNSFVFEETEEKKFLVEPSFMTDLLKQLPKSVAEVELDAEKDLVLRYAKSEFKLETIEGAEMFPMPKKKEIDESFVTIESNDLRRMIRETAFVSAKKSDSATGGDAMKCLAIYCSKNEIKINAVESVRFVSCLKAHENNGADFKALVFAEDICEAINAFQNKEIHIFADEKFMYLADDYTFISLRLVSAKEIPVDQVLKKTESAGNLTKVSVDKSTILGTIKRACLLSTERKNIGVLLQADAKLNQINLQAQSTKGSINEDIEADICGNSTEMCVNGNLLLDVLNAIDCERADLRLGSNIATPMLIKNGDDDKNTDATYAIMGIKKH